MAEAEETVKASKDRLRTLETELTDARRALDEVRAAQRAAISEAEGVMARTVAAAAAAEQRCEAAKTAK